MSLCPHAEHTVETLLTGERWTAGLQYSWKEWRWVEDRQVDRQQQLKYLTKKLSYLIFLSLLQHCNKPEWTFNFSNLCQSLTRRPASSDRTARRHVLPMGVGPFAFRYQRKWATPCQYIDTTRKATECATTLPLTIFYIMKLCSRLFVLCCRNLPKDETTNLANLSPFWGR